jgi:hypothetical protein
MRAHRSAENAARTSSEELLLRELTERVDAAIVEPRLVALVARASASNWRAAAWILERQYPTRWGPQRLAQRDEDDVDDLLGDPTNVDPFAEVDELASRRAER